MEWVLILMSLYGSPAPVGVNPSLAHVLQSPMIVGSFKTETDCLTAAVHSSKFPKSSNFPATEAGYGAAQYLCVRSK